MFTLVLFTLAIHGAVFAIDNFPALPGSDYSSAGKSDTYPSPGGYNEEGAYGGNKYERESKYYYGGQYKGK